MKHNLTADLLIIKLLLLLLLTFTITFPNGNVVHCQRKFDASAPVNRRVADDVNGFWANVTGALETTVQRQSLAVLHEWTQAVDREQLKYRVSKKCLAIVEQIIKQPLKQQWSAQSK